MFKRDDIVIIGMGQFGTSIAICLDKHKKYNITMISRDDGVVLKFNEEKSNHRCFSEYKFNNASASSDFSCEEIYNASYVFLSVRSSDLVEIATKLSGRLKKGSRIVLCSKGVSDAKPYLYYDIIKKILGKGVSIFIMSGPNFADEIANDQSTITTIAGKSLIKLQSFKFLFKGTNIKPELTTDVIGVQIFGAMKNVIAIAVGILEGMNCGKNTTIRIVMILVKELQKLTVKFGGRRNSAYLAAGIGDIMLTCFDSKSRNKTFGYRIGKGEDVDALIKEKLIEGYYAVKAIRVMSKNMTRIDKAGLECLNKIYDILYNKKHPSVLLEI